MEISDDVLLYLSQKIIDVMSLSAGNGSVHYDSDVQGAPGWVIQTAIHAIRPHKPGETFRSGNCLGCKLRQDHMYEKYQEGKHSRELSRQHTAVLKERYSSAGIEWTHGDMEDEPGGDSFVK